MSDVASPAGNVTRLAIAFMVLASALVAVTSLLAKSLGAEEGLPPFQVSAGRFCFAFLTLLIVFSFRPSLRPSLQGAHWSWHLARAILGWCGVTAMFAAVARMPVADATAISFLSPPLTMGLAVILLGEHLKVRKVLAAGLALIGGMLILRPGTDAFQAAGLLALMAAGFMAVEIIFIKKLSDAEPAPRILFVNNLIGSIVSLTVASFVWVWPEPRGWMLLIALGVVMVSAQSMFIQSMKRGEASLVTPVFYAVLVFAALFDFVLYGVSPTGFTLAGSAFIVAGAMMLAAKTQSGTR